MFHLTGFGETIDAAAVFANIQALADALGMADGDEMIVPALDQVALISAGVTSGSTERCRLDSPSLRRLSRLDVVPLNGGGDADAEPGSPPALMDFRRNPIQLERDERLQAQVDSDSTAAQFQWALLWLANGPIEPYTGGKIFQARAAGTTTLTVDVWTNGTITFTDALPVGRYAIVGANVRAAGLVAARFAVAGETWRPGVLGNDDVNDIESSIFRAGNMGVFLEFESTLPPTVDYLSISADTAETLILDLVQVRAGRG